jgi:hypothetical protein
VILQPSEDSLRCRRFERRRGGRRSELAHGSSELPHLAREAATPVAHEQMDSNRETAT